MLILYVSLGLAAIVLNAFFIACLWRRSKVSVTHKYYLCSLATTNLFTSVLCLNWDIRMNKQPNDTPPWVCVLQFYGVQIGLYSSLGVVLVMSIDKCLAITQASLYRTMCSMRNTRIALVLVYTVAVSLAFLPTEDFVASLSSVCTVIDLYPRRYGVIIIGTNMLAYLLAQIVALTTLVFSMIKYLMGPASEDTQNRSRLMKAHRATRIVICSLVLYSLTLIPMIAFFYWLSRREVDIVYILLHDFSMAVNCLLIVLTYIDPFIYFLCVFRKPFTIKIEPITTRDSAPSSRRSP